MNALECGYLSVPPRLSTWREKHLSARPGGTSRREGRVLGVLMAGDWGANLSYICDHQIGKDVARWWQDFM